MKPYFETSVLVPIYVPETFSSVALARLAGASEVYVSWLSEVEFFAALAKKICVGALRTSEARLAADAFSAHLESGALLRSPVPDEAFERARDFLKSFSTSLRSLDALHLACCASSRLLLVTADTTLAKGAARFGIELELLATA